MRSVIDVSIYDEPTLGWASTSFVETQAMIHDRFLFDRRTNSWTVDRFLADLTDRYGGIDIVMLWHSYPNIGVDDRNQFDMLASLPGGIDGLKQLVQQFHAKGVRVLLCFNPWDTGTHNAYAHASPFERVAEAVKAVGADGFNGDQMYGVPNGFQAAARDAGMRPMVLEPEICFNNSVTGVGTDVMTWSGAYQFDSQPFPMVLSYKVLEMRHMVHVLHRDGKDRTRAVQTSWFNGAGLHTWENCFGIWNGLTPRVAAATKAVAAFLRLLGPLVQGKSTHWRPHVPIATQTGLFASEFSNASHTLWTLVNVNNTTDVKGASVSLPCNPASFSDYAWYNLWVGEEIPPSSLHCGSRTENSVGRVSLRVEVERSGFGGLLRVNRSDTAAVQGVAAMLHVTRSLTETPLQKLNGTWTPLQQTLSSGLNTTAPMSAVTASRLGMVAIPGVAEFNFSVGALGVNRGEAGPAKLPEAVDVQYPGEPHPQEDHSNSVTIHPFFLSKYAVTKEDYAAFLNATGWRPAIVQNWLKDWISSTSTARTHAGGGDVFVQKLSVPVGQGKLPVVWVSREDAAAYCEHHGARLPHEWEWQYAGQGTEGRLWPWGNVGDNDTTGYTHRPNVSHATVMPPPAAVDAYPSGASAFGVEGMVGGVREWTDVYTDEHTSRAVLRGGSYWSPLPQPSVVRRYLFNYSSDIGFTDGAPNWYYPNPLVSFVRVHPIESLSCWPPSSLDCVLGL
jgi:formylglycine-generating enzyme required for sulfatase activity